MISQDARPTPQISPEAIAADISFDLNLARASLFVDGLSYALIVYVGSRSSTIFISATLLAVSILHRCCVIMAEPRYQAFGGGAFPAMQSAALCLLPNSQEEVGKLFGAISMLQAMGASILSVSLFIHDSRPA